MQPHEASPVQEIAIEASVKRAYRSRWERHLGETQSFIEAAFLDAFCAIATEAGYKIGRRALRSDTIAVQPQKAVDAYIADFVVAFRFHGAEINIVVECDGHDYHERTREQARHDRRRDRAMSSLGYEVMRFTGSEINANAGLCASEVLTRIMDFQTGVVVAAAERCSTPSQPFTSVGSAAAAIVSKIGRGL